MTRKYYQHYDPITREYWYRGTWYDSTDEAQMKALEQRKDDEANAAVSDIYWDEVIG